MQWLNFAAEWGFSTVCPNVGCPTVVPPASTHTAACLSPISCPQATQMLSGERKQDHTLPTLLIVVYLHRSSTNIKKYSLIMGVEN